jgi:enamine deaminase RidA (YjgF/YER057c/UK114 family)
VAKPFAPYSHAVEVPEGSRLLYISGEVGVLPDGTAPQGIEAQAEACWRNIIAILADAGMRDGDMLKITTYLVRPEDVAAAGAARAKHFGDARPGSATIIVKARVVPEWLIEIEAVAAAKLDDVLFKARWARMLLRAMRRELPRPCRACVAPRSVPPRSGIDLHNLVASTR